MLQIYTEDMFVKLNIHVVDNERIIYVLKLNAFDNVMAVFTYS
jgi:hypothetical protein